MFRVLNADGTEFGKGCFTYQGPAEGVDIQYNYGTVAGGTANQILSFWYYDPVVGVMDKSNVITMNFTRGWHGAYRFDLNLWNYPQNTKGMTAGQATPNNLGPISGHRGNGDVSNQKRLEFPKVAPLGCVCNEAFVKSR